MRYFKRNALDIVNFQRYSFYARFFTIFVYSHYKRIIIILIQMIILQRILFISKRLLYERNDFYN